jgi:hypothetical protein
MRRSMILFIFFVWYSPCFSGTTVSAQTIDEINFDALYKQEGIVGLKPYTQALSDSIIAILGDCTGENRYRGEYNGERVLYFLRFLSLIAQNGDMHTKDALIEAMICPGIYSSSIDKGLIYLGSPVKPEILSHLDDDNWEFRDSTINTLRRMVKYDSTGTYFSKEYRESIRNKLVTILADRSHNEPQLTRTAIRALADFGDESVIPLLEKLGKEVIPGLEPALIAPGIPYIPGTPQEVIEYLREKKK